MPLNFNCEFCGKGFVKASTFQVHMCEKKRRHFSRDERHVTAGLAAFKRFYEMTVPSASARTFEDFIDSPYYTAFVKFGSFMINASPIYPDRFIDYIIKSGVKLDKWCRDDLYERYVSEMIKIEPSDKALERTVKTMMTWGDKNQQPWNHYFELASVNLITNHILDGLISPWVILNCKAGKNALTRLSDDQLDIISLVIDPNYWFDRFNKLPNDVTFVKQIIKEAQLR